MMSVNGAEQPKQVARLEMWARLRCRAESGQFRDRRSPRCGESPSHCVGALDRGQHHLLQGMLAPHNWPLAVLADVHMPEHLVAAKGDVMGRRDSADSARISRETIVASASTVEFHSAKGSVQIPFLGAV